MDDHELAAHLARSAGARLTQLRELHATADQMELKRLGDRTSQAHLAAELARWRPDDALLSEEAVDDTARLDAERVWIIDPLDGTREFSEPPREDWAVHVALWSRPAAGGAGDLVAGAVALPARDVVFATPDAALGQVVPGPPRVVVSRTRPPAVAMRVRDALGGELVELGSAGAKVVAVIEGRADVYVHAGGQYEWDSAAPVAVARAAGLHTSRLDGTALTYNRPDPLLPDLIVCRAHLAAAVLDAVR